MSTPTKSLGCSARYDDAGLALDHNAAAMRRPAVAGSELPRRDHRCAIVDQKKQGSARKALEGQRLRPIGRRDVPTRHRLHEICQQRTMCLAETTNVYVVIDA
jgi:hypothetical protein